MKKLLLFIVIFSLAVGQNYSLSFDGVDDYVEISNDILAFDEARTILLQVKSQDGGGTLYSSYTNQSGEYRVSTESNGSYFTLKGSDGNWVTAGNNTSLITDEWIYITGVWDLNEIKIYENENLIDSTPLTGTLAQNTFNGNTGIGVSAAHYNMSYNGNIVKTAVWNRGLSESEIINIVQGEEILNYSNSLIGYWNFNEGSGTTLTDLSGNGNHGTIYGATWVQNIYGCTDALATNYNAEANFDDGSCTYPDNGDYSLSFDGSWEDPHYVNIGRPISLYANESATISIRFNSSSEGGYLINNDTSPGNPQFKIWVSDDGHLIINGASEIFDIVGNYNNNQWYELFVLIEEGCVIAYIEDIELESCGHGNMDTGDDFYIGAERSSYDSQAGPFYHGLISKVQLWNYSIENFENPSEPNAALYKFNAGSGDILYDHSGNGNHGTINGATWISNTDFESLTISPLSLDFGEVRLGESGELTVDFGNNGEEELSVNITPTDQLSVSLDDFIVYPGSSVPVNVTYTPTVEGEYIGSLNILSNDAGDPDFDMEVTGIGIAEPIINITPQSLQFDVVVFDDTLATQTLTITNTGFDTLEVSLNSGIMDYALEFDGVDDWVEFNPTGLPQGNSNHTISSWIYATPVTGERQWVLILGNPGTGAHHWIIENNNLMLGRWNGGSTSSEPIFNEWFYLTVTYDGNYTKSYINGEFITEVAMSGQNYSLSNYLRIAKRWDGDDWNGKMSDLSIFNRALTQEEIQANMYAELTGNEEGLVGYWNFNVGEGSVLHDLSANGNDGTIYGATWVESPFSTSVEWISLSETTLTIPPGESANIEITANANGYECGDYDGSIQLTTNDPENPVIEIPVNMSVLYPTALVDESPINFGEVGFNNTAEIQVPIMNDGCYSLEAIASLENANLTISPDTLFVEAGDTSFFTITMASDMDEVEIVSNLVFSYNDPSNNSDTISVSATIVPDIHPIITNIEDVPNDQGGWVRVHFTRSYHDTDSLRNLEQYTVQINNAGNWESYNSTTAYNENIYTVVTHTPLDSSSTYDGLLDFRIIAGMEEGNFVSETVQGYSVDNIIPSELSGLTVSSASSENITLDWTANIDDDLAGYNIYRDNEEPSFSTVSGYIDNEPLNTHFTYIVKAVDVHGNESIGSRMYMNRHQLAFGNNLISLPGNLENDSSQDLLNELNNNNCSNPIFLLGQGVGLFKTVDGWSGNLNNVLPTSGYWLNVDGSCDFNNEYWTVDFDSSLAECESYPISFGNNLLSFRWGKGNKSTMEALGGEAFATENFNFILGQGLGLFNTTDGWSGNLNNLEEGKGYWVNISNGSIDFKWGFDNCAEPTESSVLAKTESTIPQEFRVNQSTEQAFYLIKELIIDGKYPVAEDLILAYHNNILVGSANYSELTVLPIMGRDVSEQTIGFIEAGQIPQLKLLKANGELVDLHADLEPFSNLLVSEVQTVTGSTIVIPTEFVLHPAYPNPFNPITNISFGLPIDTQVTLNIYDVEGRKVTTLTEGIRTAGNHTIEWNAENYPSGVYFVKLDAGDPSANSGQGFTQTQKLMLVK